MSWLVRLSFRIDQRPLVPDTVLGRRTRCVGVSRFLQDKPRGEGWALAPGAPPALSSYRRADSGAAESGCRRQPGHFWSHCSVVLGLRDSGHSAGSSLFLPRCTQRTASVVLSPPHPSCLGDATGLGVCSLPGALRGLSGLFPGRAILSC